MALIDQLLAADWSLASGIMAGAYLLGCFTTGYYLVLCLRGEDIRQTGSGNLGARNVGRFLGWQGFMITVLGDFSKGVFAVWAAQHFTKDPNLLALALLAVVVGHVWPIQLKFHGGKGVACSLGGLLVYDYRLLFAFVILCACAFCFTRKTVLPGLFAYACLPLASMFLHEERGKTVAISCLAAIILVAHRKNLVEEVSHLMERRNAQPKPNHRHL
jgi:glycerol-3-phosphate acyltransferase PlsY